MGTHQSGYALLEPGIQTEDVTITRENREDVVVLCSALDPDHKVGRLDCGLDSSYMVKLWRRDDQFWETKQLVIGFCVVPVPKGKQQ